MIKEKQAKAFCREDISLIENYDLAIADQTKVWDCHHRNGIQFSRDELKAKGLYWKRPASELIFLTRSEHTRLHKIGNQYTKGIIPWNKGLPKEQQPNYGKHWSVETKAKQSAAHKGQQTNLGKHWSVETKAKQSAAMKGRYCGEKSPKAKAVYQIHKATGIIIREWKCISDVTRVLGIAHTNIVACCKGKRKSTGGFRWRYVD